MDVWSIISSLIIMIVMVVGYQQLFIQKKPAPPPPKPATRPSISSSPATSTKKEEEDVNKPSVSIMFGSQSGTAETFARELSSEARKLGFRTHVHDLEKYDATTHLHKESFAVLLMATFGEGEPTDNAADFYKWIMNAARVDEEQQAERNYTNVTFAVFALGNRQYEHFCNVGRNIDRRLGELGAQRLLEHGEGDDDGSLEDDYKAWKTKFWDAARAKFLTGGAAAAAAASSAAHQLFVPSFEVAFLNDDASPSSDSSSLSYASGERSVRGDSKHRVFYAPVIENRELKKDVADGSSTRHIEIDISSKESDSSLSYLTADNLGVHPRNDYRLASILAKRLGVKFNLMFTVRRAAHPSASPTPSPSPSEEDELLPIPSPCTVEDALLWHCDFNALARSSQLSVLAQYTNDTTERSLIQQWQQSSADFNRCQFSNLELLLALPQVTLPLAVFLEWCPRIQPRFYTISSSAVVQPHAIAVTVALTIDNKENHELLKYDDRPRVHRGVASTYLCELRPNRDTLAIFVRPSSFRLPKSISLNGSSSSSSSSSPSSASSSSSSLPPVIMIGPGTGIAPFRAFVQEFSYLRQSSSSTLLPSSSTLYFGCRHPNKDYLYENELTAANSSGALTQLHVAFSRFEGKPKTYVQDLMKVQAADLWRGIHEQGGYVYVCGATAMGRSVRESIIQIAQSEGKLSAADAVKYFQQLQENQRYVAELWSA